MNKSRQVAQMEATEQRLLQRGRTADVVIVQSYDPGAGRVSVKPLVSRVSEGVAAAQPPLLAVPVVMSSVETEPQISVGDIGVVLYLDVDSDNAIKTGAEGVPNSNRIHSADDAVFLGVIRKG
ncbi:MAG: Gp138 family membrane-puncturing spike protein [Lachnospiraceae bacterium]